MRFALLLSEQGTLGKQVDDRVDRDLILVPLEANKDICEILISVFADPNFKVDGITGEGMTWTANGEVNKAPKAVVIKDGVYVGL